MSDIDLKSAIADVRWAAHMLNMQLLGTSQRMDLLAAVRVLVQAARDGAYVNLEEQK